MANEEILKMEVKELTAEQLEDLAREIVTDVVADEELDDVSGGTGAPGTKLFLVIKDSLGYDKPDQRVRKVVCNLSRGVYLRNCCFIKVEGVNDYHSWVRFDAIGTSRNGPWALQLGWAPYDNLNLLPA